MKRLYSLIGLGLGLWALLILPGVWLQGELAWVQSAVAFVVCVIPAAGTALWVDQAGKRSADMQMLASLGGSGVRLAVIMGIGTFLYFRFPDTFTPVFWLWIGVFYSVLLTAEIVLLVNPSMPASGNDLTVSV